MNFKYWLLVGLLGLGIIFLGLDKCGSSKKADELRGQYEEASRIAKVERLIKEEVIKEQQGIIKKQDLLIVESRKEVEIKNSYISSLGNTVAELEGEFDSLTDKDEKIANLVTQVSIWKEKFTLAQSIISDKDAIIFSLTQKYESQLKISNSYKDMHESIQPLVEICTKQVKELEKINRRLKFTSKLKTGVVVSCALLFLYNMVK
jgi:hypothetical protein